MHFHQFSLIFLLILSLLKMIEAVPVPFTEQQLQQATGTGGTGGSTTGTSSSGGHYVPIQGSPTIKVGEKITMGPGPQKGCTPASIC